MIKVAKFGGSSVADAEHFKKIKAIVGERIDTLCRGGCLIPFGNSSTPFFRQAVEECVAERADFYEKPENRRIPD